MKNMDYRLWVLLWSKQQDALHIEPLDEMLKINQRAFAEERGGDYRTLHIGYREEVDSLAASYRNTLHARETDRQKS